MSASQPDKVQVPCPHCGHRQLEPRTAISTNCRACGRHFHLQENNRQARKLSEPSADHKHITCFECGTNLKVPVSAQSTMCKQCSSYIDLSDYRIASAVSKNFKTKGAFVLEPKGYLFNTQTIVGDAIIKGKFLGKLTVERSLTIFSTAEIKGQFTAHRLIIPAGNKFWWRDPIRVDSAEIAGELVGKLQAAETVMLKASGRLFGDLTTRNLVVEAGAVFVGHAQVKPNER